VKSLTHNRLGLVAVNRRLTRSGARAAAGSEMVVRRAVPRTTPAMPREPRDPIPPHYHTLAVQLLPDLAGTIDLVVLGPDPADLDHELLVTDLAGRRLPALGRVVAGWGDLQGPADRLDPEPVTMRVNVAGHLGRRPSSSAAKKAEAVRRISFARRSSRTSRSSAAMRCCSAVVTPGRWP
jgi:hypothetical protein